MAGINEKTNENGLEDYYKSHNELTPNELNLTHNELDKLRGEIDQIDRQLLKLFEARMDTAAKVARYKEANNLAITDKAREQKVLDQIALWARPEYKEQVRILFQTIMDLSKQVQARHMTRTAGIVGYQGMPGSFSEQAVLEYFGDGPLERKNYASFEDVCKALQAKDIDYGVLPLENSLTGGITEVYDLLSAYGFYIVGEKIVKIDHNLLVNPGTRLESVREVISHPQAFLQCSNFLKRHPEWKLISCSNTAVSAKMLAERANNHQAVIAGKRAAELYGLQVLAEGIHDSPDNCTRFIVIGRQLQLAPQSNKISLIVGIAHEPGSLCKILSHFAEQGLNMLKIESRPNRSKNWEYLFYIDFAGNLKTEAVQKAVDKIKRESNFFKLLGNYCADNG